MDFVSAIRQLFDFFVGRIDFLLDFITDSVQITSFVTYIWNFCIPFEIKYVFEFSLFACLFVWLICVFFLNKD